MKARERERALKLNVVRATGHFERLHELRESRLVLELVIAVA